MIGRAALATQVVEARPQGLPNRHARLVGFLRQHYWKSEVACAILVVAPQAARDGAVRFFAWRLFRCMAGPAVSAAVDPKDLFLAEYSSLKSEQRDRIGFRDRLIITTLGLFGGIGSFALLHSDHIYVLLVLPWAALIIGWTYVVNDEKISAIGDYIRTRLRPQLTGAFDPKTAGACFGWEEAHQVDDTRMWRKCVQFTIDQLMFVISSWAAITIFCLSTDSIDWKLGLLCGVEAALTLGLFFAICKYARFRGKSYEHVSLAGTGQLT